MLHQLSFAWRKTMLLGSQTQHQTQHVLLDSESRQTKTVSVNYLQLFHELRRRNSQKVEHQNHELGRSKASRQRRRPFLLMFKSHLEDHQRRQDVFLSNHRQMPVSAETELLPYASTYFASRCQTILSRYRQVLWTPITSLHPRHADQIFRQNEM